MLVGVGTLVGVLVGCGILVGVFVGSGILVGVDVACAVGVLARVDVATAVGEAVGVDVTVTGGVDVGVTEPTSVGVGVRSVGEPPMMMVWLVQSVASRPSASRPATHPWVTATPGSITMADGLNVRLAPAASPSSKSHCK